MCILGLLDAGVAFSGILLAVEYLVYDRMAFRESTFF